jgi:hypothetical protein
VYERVMPIVMKSWSIFPTEKIKTRERVAVRPAYHRQCYIEYCQQSTR